MPPSEPVSMSISMSISTPRTPPSTSKQGGFRNLKVTPTMLRHAMNLWFPYLGAGIHITTISEDFRFVRVELKMHWYNRNYFNTHFGGSLYAMTDPFYALMLTNILGKHYVVWDKAADIQFRTPGKGTVHCEFSLTEEQITTIKTQTDTLGKYEPQFEVFVKNAEGAIVARVLKTLYIRNTAQSSL
jgi:Domain of unknown function (DUF4442)